MTSDRDLDAAALAAAVRSGQLKAIEIVEVTLARIARLDPALNCFTRVLSDRARAAALGIDARVARGEDPGPLCGVPFGVKNLFDVAGVVTLAGSKILRERAPAARDALVIERLSDAGAILIGALNMDEFAYGFTTENEHYGPTHNPHDPSRIAGGSSGGSAAAVAARLLPITLGTDTNGSVRVPAALCGIFGIKPTYGRLPRDGMFPFADSFDHVGLFARTARDLELAYHCADLKGAGRNLQKNAEGNRRNDAQGNPKDDAERHRREHFHASRQDTDDASPLDVDGAAALRVGILGGWFEQHAGDGVLEAVAAVAAAFPNPGRVELPMAEVARSAAYCITAAEGGTLHLENLRSRPQDFDHATRDRLIAGTLLPAAVIMRAQRFRRWFLTQVMEIFQQFDLLVAPSTLCFAPLIGQTTVRHGEDTVAVRANLGLYTQPISFIGLPVVAVPVATDQPMPLGVQLIAAPWREDVALRAAAILEKRGIVGSRPFESAA